MPHAMNDVILQNETKELYHDYQEYLQFQHLYQAAVQSIQMRLEVLNEEFSVKYAASPIHHIESRVKSTKSIIEKLKRKNCEISMASAKEHVNDIAGIRVVCNYIDDVYSVEQMLLRQTDMELIKRQDYIAEPNYNGYRSLHLDMRVPIFLSDHTEYVLAEIQIRSVAMDFWASLEHKIAYKFEGNAPDYLEAELKACADMVDVLDAKMFSLNQAITELEEQKSQEAEEDRE